MTAELVPDVSRDKKRFLWVLGLVAPTGLLAILLLIPTVVLAAGQPTTVHTELITTVHDSTLTGIGDPQRDQYTMTELTGEASQAPLPG